MDQNIISKNSDVQHRTPRIGHRTLDIHLLTLLLLFLSFISNNTCAQADTDWSKNFGAAQSEQLMDFLPLANEEIVFLSLDKTVEARGDFCIRKIDAQQNEMWSSCYGGNQLDQASKIITLSDGSFILAGHSFSNDFLSHGSQGSADAFLMKLDANRNVQWLTSFGGNNLDVINDIVETATGNYIVTGYTYSDSGDLSSNQGMSDLWLCKINEAGNLLWSKNFGGTGIDQGNTLLITANNEIVVVGTSSSNNAFGDGLDDVYLLKVNQNAELIWEKNFGGDGIDQAFDIASLDNGDLLIAGSSSSFGGDVGGIQGLKDGWVFKVNQQAALVWSKTIGGSQNDDLFSLVPTLENKIIVAGTSDSKDGAINNVKGQLDVFLAELDLSGNLDWIKNYGGSKNEHVITLKENDKGAILFGGYSESNNNDLTSNFGKRDAWLLKLEAPPLLLLSLGEDQEICVGESITINPEVINCNNCSYSWSDESTASSRTLTLSTSTNFNLTVTDSEGKTASDEIFIKVNPLPEWFADQSNISCFSFSDGSIDLNLPADQVYQINWSNGMDKEILNALDAGTYEVTITSKKECSSTASYQITTPTLFELSSANIVNVACSGTATGSIDANFSGGTANYIFLWHNGATTQKIENLAAGDYLVTVLDANACKLLDTFHVSTASALQIESSLTNVSCYGKSEGQINLELTGGSGDFSFTWNNDSSTKDLQNLAAGNYTLSLTDGTCGTNEYEYQITQVDSIKIDFDLQNATIGNNDGKIFTQVSGGTAPYTFQWNNGETTDSIVNLIAADYSLIVEDANGCQKTIFFVLDEVVAVQNIIGLASFDVFPNPTKGQFSLSYKLEETQEVNILLFNDTGILIQSLQANSASFSKTFQGNNLADGLYFLQLQTHKGTATKKLILIK